MGRGAKPTAISLYTGAGGLDYGLEAAGFRTALALELDAECCATLRHNRRFRLLEDDIYQVPTEALLRRARLTPGQVDLLHAGPPCQPFSKSGYWATGDAGRLSDPRSSTLAAFMRVVEESLPRVMLLENVDALSYQGKREGLRLVQQRIEQINRRAGTHYPTDNWQVLRAADYGVPQVRDRFFMVAARDGTPFRFPKATHAPADEQLPLGMEPYHTAWDALADVQPEDHETLQVTGKWAGLLPTIPEGENYLWHTERGGGEPLFGWRRRYWSFLLKLARNRPSWTIQAQPGPATGPFHWDNRRLSMRELCRLQTMPDDVTILGGRALVQRQVGNAVPSLLGEVMGRAIRAQLLGQRPANRPYRLLPTRRPLAHTPLPLAPVPPSLLSLRGEHEAHPGTGKGTRARIRKERPVQQQLL